MRRLPADSMTFLERLREWSSARTRPPFQRTVCACKDCTSFCKTKPGALIPSDVPRIARRLVELKLIEREEDVGRYLRATRPSTVYENDTGKTIEIPKIGPARDRRGRCVLLDESNRCTIHQVAPFGCAYFDAHMDKTEVERRWIWALQQIRVNVQYHRLRDTLAHAEGGKNESR